METKGTEGKTTVYVSSRKSDLAMAQTNEVVGKLQECFPNIEFVIGQEDSLGDKDQKSHLSDLGTSMNTGVFTKSLEEQLIAGKTAFAVHSLKDMPTQLPPGLMLASITKRAGPEDAVILHPKHKANGITKLEQLPEGSVIGTSSLRREALLLHLHPSFTIKTIRGNIHTRLSKLENGDDYDAIVIAACGYKRVGMGDRLDQILSADTFGYGVGQASIGIECRIGDQETLDMVRKVQDEVSAQQCLAERSLLYHIEGGCQIAMGVNTTMDGDELTLTATVLSRDGKQSVRDTASGNLADAEAIGKSLAEKLLQHELAAALIGDAREKRVPTYGSAETPGDAAAAAAAAAKQ